MSAKTTTILAALLGAAFLCLGACSPQTKIGASWKDPDYTMGRIKNVLVIGHGSGITAGSAAPA